MQPAGQSRVCEAMDVHQLAYSQGQDETVESAVEGIPIIYLSLFPLPLSLSSALLPSLPSFPSLTERFPMIRLRSTSLIK